MIFESMYTSLSAAGDGLTVVLL